MSEDRRWGSRLREPRTPSAVDIYVDSPGDVYTKHATGSTWPTTVLSGVKDKQARSVPEGGRSVLGCCAGRNRSVTQQRRGPTEAERRPIQRAVDSGDLKRAQELLAGVRRRLAKTSKNKKLAPQESAGQRSSKTPTPKAGRKRSSGGGYGVRLAGTARFTLCPACRREFSVNTDGRLRAHRDQTRGGRCDGSGAKVAKARKATKAHSIRAVSGGLPGLGKRQ